MIDLKLPWRADSEEPYLVENKNGIHVASFQSDDAARRAIACVNACERFSDEELDSADLWQRAHEQSNTISELKESLDESRANDRAAMGWLADCRIASGDNGKRMLPEFVEYLRDLKRQRDDLLAALERIKGLPGKHHKDPIACANQTHLIVELAISNAKGDCVQQSAKNYTQDRLSRIGDTQAMKDVISERKRQINVEGWTPEHDDHHSRRELSAAAECYAGASGKHDECPAIWPWDKSWWKPRNYRRNLVKAAALLIAEIERIDRSAIASVNGDAA